MRCDDDDEDELDYPGGSRKESEFDRRFRLPDERVEALRTPEGNRRPVIYSSIVRRSIETLYSLSVRIY